MEIVNTVPITLDFRKPSKIPMPQVNQYDTNEFEFTVLNNGTPADLSTADRIVANYRRPDKAVITREITALGNVITYSMGSEEMAVEGLGELNVQLFAEGRRVSSMKMKVYVHQNLGAAFEGGEGLPLLQDLFVEVSGLLEDTQTSATYALNQGDYAKEQADIAAIESANLSQLKAGAESSTESANTAAELANTNAAEAETQGAYAKDQGDYAKAEADRLVGTDVSTLSAQLADVEQEAKRKRELEDLSPNVLSAIEGGEGTSFNLLSIPQDGSVDIGKFSPDVKSTIEELTSDVISDTTATLTTSWELGSLNANGDELSATDRYRTGYIDIRNFDTVKMGNNLKMFRVNLYDVNKVSLGQANFDITSYTKSTNVAYIRILRMVDMSNPNTPVYGYGKQKTGVAPNYIVTAAKYNFLPNNSASENRVALQNAIDAGGEIVVSKPGIYDIDKTIKLGDNVTLKFEAGVFIRRTTTDGYVFINKGAYTRSWNKNIKIKGLKLICNGFESTTGSDLIVGLRGHVSFFYVKDFTIEDFECLDLGWHSYCIQICTWENIRIENVRIEGDKDAIHLGKGNGFVIKNVWAKTYDDPIALNAHDYDTGAPQLGWIENGILENIYDLADDTTTGYFARILAGSWVDWYEGMQVQKSDTVVHNGRMYRVFINGNGNGTLFTSNTPPTHTTGTVQIDGINWVMIQDDEITYDAGCRNIHFKNIFFQKSRSAGISIHFDKNNDSRSYYPNSTPPIQENLVFENLHMQAPISSLFAIKTPVSSIKLINCDLLKTWISLQNIGTTGLVYPSTKFLLANTTFKSNETYELIGCQSGRTATLKVYGSVEEYDSHNPKFSSSVTVISSDL